MSNHIFCIFSVLHTSCISHFYTMFIIMNLQLLRRSKITVTRICRKATYYSTDNSAKHKPVCCTVNESVPKTLFVYY